MHLPCFSRGCRDKEVSSCIMNFDFQSSLISSSMLKTAPYACRRISCFQHLTLIPSNRDKALRGLKALRVLRDLMAPSSEQPKALATRLTKDTYTETEKQREVPDCQNESLTLIEQPGFKTGGPSCLSHRQKQPGRKHG